MKIKKIINIIILLSVITFIFSYLGKYHWIPDFFSHFRMYYFFFFSIAIVYCITLKKYIKSGIIFILLLCIIIEIFPFYKQKKLEQAENSLKVGSINLLSFNKEYSALENFLKKENFDLFFVYELSPAWEFKINQITGLYPFKKLIVRDDFFGIGLYSKIPLTSSKKAYFSEIKVPSIVADLKFEDKPITIIGTHPEPPNSKEGFNSRNEQFENINQLVTQSKNSIIIVGDFNCSSFSANMNRLTKNTTLTDSRIGFGIQNSWNAKNILFSIAIDHCFITNDFNVINRKIGPYIGSDHYPISVTLNFK